MEYLANTAAGAVSGVSVAAQSDALFMELGQDARNKFYATVRTFEKMRGLVEKGATPARAAKLVAKSENISARNLQRLFERVRDANGHWSAFLDKRHASKLWRNAKEENSAALPKAFLDHWQKLCLENQRCNRQAWFKLLRQLEAWRNGGDGIPGYDTPPPNCGRCNFPQGWSYGNLTRFSPDKTELAAARLGRFAAASTLPGVRTSRAGSYFFCELQFDDMWHDFMVSDFGNNPGAVRMLEFGCVDFHSGYHLPPLLKPRLAKNKEQPDGTFRNLNARDFRFYLATVLTQYGYNPRGTTLTVENGTAAINAELEDVLKTASKGALKVIRAGINARAAYLGAYSERGKGNPKAKALKEGSGRLVHDVLADLPAQVGTGVSARPAELWGRLKEFSGLAKIISRLPEPRRAEFRLGILDSKTAGDLIFEAYNIINARTMHKLEGWDALGYYITEIRLPTSSEWVRLDDVLSNASEQAAAFVREFAKSGENTRRRYLSPAEVYKMHAAELVRLPEYITPLILGVDYQTRRTPRRTVFEFEDREIAPNTRLRFDARARKLDGETVLLKDGREYLTCVNPFNPSKMFVSDLDGSFIGVCARWTVPARTDAQAVLRDMGKVSGMYNAALARVNRLAGNSAAAARTERQAYNAKILNSLTAADFLPQEDEDAGARTNAEDGAFAGSRGFSLTDFMDE